MSDMIDFFGIFLSCSDTSSYEKTDFLTYVYNCITEG